MIDKLQKKLTEYIQGRDQAIANVQAFNGAIQALQTLIQEEQAASQPETQEKVTKAQLPPASKNPKVLTIKPEQAQ